MSSYRVNVVPKGGTTAVSQGSQRQKTTTFIPGQETTLKNSTKKKGCLEALKSKPGWLLKIVLIVVLGLIIGGTVVAVTSLNSSDDDDSASSDDDDNQKATASTPNCPAYATPASGTTRHLADPSSLAKENQFQATALVEADSSGTILAIISSNHLMGNVGTTPDDILVVKSTDYGQTWAERAHLNSNSRDATRIDRYASAAVSDAGVVVVWESDAGNNAQEIMFAFSSDKGDTWTSEAPIIPSNAGVDEMPRVISLQGQKVLAVWVIDDAAGSAGSNKDIVSSRSNDGGQSWEPFQFVNSYYSAYTSDDDYPDAVWLGGDKALVAWANTGNTGYGFDGDVFCSLTSDGGSTWGTAVPINRASSIETATDKHVQLAATQDGSLVIAVWQNRDTWSSTWDIAASLSTDLGSTWSTPAAISDTTNPLGHETFPFGITFLGGNQIILVAYATTDDLSGTTGTDMDIAFVRSTDAGVSWSTPAPLDPNAAVSNMQDRYPSLLPLSCQGGVVMAFWSTKYSYGPVDTMDSDVVYSISTDSGSTWT